MTTHLDAGVLGRLNSSPVLTDPNRTIKPLTGGLTNQNFLVSVGARRYVARLAGQSSELLAIDRQAEYRNSLSAADTGIAPSVIDFQPETGVLVVDFLTGRTLGEADVRNAQMVDRIADACRTLHGAARFVSDFDMFALQQRYLDTVRGLGLRLPDRYLDFMPQVAELRSVLTITAAQTVPCHNDLLAENVIEDAGRLWFIDFEYSGNNDPCFELGNIASESHLPPEALVALTDRYFGRHDPMLIARTQLQSVMSQYGWTLWGVIQQAASGLEVDFWSWSMDKFERAASTLSSSTLPRLIRIAGGEDP